MNYKRIYNEFIADRRAKEADLIASGEYFERHHILPRSLGGGDEAENLIALTAGDHVFAHLLLAKIHGGSQWVPLLRMVNLPTHVANRHAISASRKNRFAYELAKVNNAKYQSEKRIGKLQVGFVAYNAARENLTVYQWEHKATGELVSATLREMSEKTGMRTNTLSSIANGHTKSNRGWKLAGVKIMDRSEYVIDRSYMNAGSPMQVAAGLKRRGANNGKARSVMCIETREVFDTISDAAESKSCQRANINRAIRSGKTCGGFHWAYAA